MLRDLTPKMISAVLQVDRDTVINWHTKGLQIKQKNRKVKTLRLAAYRMGGRWFISREALREFLLRLHVPNVGDLLSLLDSSQHDGTT